MKDDDEKDPLYVYAMLLSLLWLFSWASKGNAVKTSQILFMRVRSQLINLVYIKMMSMSSFMVKKQEFGKIINLFSADFNRI